MLLVSNRSPAGDSILLIGGVLLVLLVALAAMRHGFVPLIVRSPESTWFDRVAYALSLMAGFVYYVCIRWIHYMLTQSNEELNWDSFLGSAFYLAAIVLGAFTFLAIGSPAAQRFKAALRERAHTKRHF